MAALNISSCQDRACTAGLAPGWTDLPIDRKWLTCPPKAARPTQCPESASCGRTNRRSAQPLVRTAVLTRKVSCAAVGNCRQPKAVPGQVRLTCRIWDYPKSGSCRQAIPWPALGSTGCERSGGRQKSGLRRSWKLLATKAVHDRVRAEVPDLGLLAADKRR